MGLPVQEQPPVGANSEEILPPATIAAVDSIDCLQKMQDDPDYKCADYHFLGNAAPVQPPLQQTADPNSKPATAEEIASAQAAVADAKATSGKAQDAANEAKKYAQMAAQLVSS